MKKATKELLEHWREEQYKVASQVVVLDDDDVTCTNAVYRDKYKVIPLNEHESNISSKQSPKDMLLGGVDVSFYPQSANDDDSNSSDTQANNDMAIAVYVIMRGQEILYQNSIHFRLTIPYVSSYLSYREIEPLEQLVTQQMMDKSELTPSFILVDGNGILHERSAGIASFLGVRTGIPTIGVGKSLYCVDGLSKDGVKQGVIQQVNDLIDRKDSVTCEQNKRTTEAGDDRECLIVSKQGAMESSLMTQVDCKLLKESDSGQCDELTQDQDTVGTETASSRVRSLPEAMQELSTVCQGFGVPLIGSSGKVWGAALIGHGGRGETSSRRRGKNHDSTVGTKVPIFISIGHKVSLNEALMICANVSSARIPEPVRQADLIGRSIVRSMSSAESVEQED